MVVLVVVVQAVLGPRHGLDDLDRRAAVELHLRHVVEPADAAGDVRRRRALERGDDADDVGIALRRDADDAQRQLLDLLHDALGRIGDHLAEAAVVGDDDEADRVDWRSRARREHRSLDAALAAVVEEGADRREVAEVRAVHAGLGAGRQGLADLGDDEPDVVRRHLHPVEALDVVDRPELEAQAGHQEVGLVARFALAGQQLVPVELAADALGDQADLGGADGVQALEQHEQPEQHRNGDDEEDHGDVHVDVVPFNRCRSRWCGRRGVVCRRTARRRRRWRSRRAGGRGEAFQRPVERPARRRDRPGG